MSLTIDEEMTLATAAADKAESRADALTQVGNFVLAIAVLATVAIIVASGSNDDSDNSRLFFVASSATSLLLSGVIFRTLFVGLASLVELNACKLRLDLHDRRVARRTPPPPAG